MPVSEKRKLAELEQQAAALSRNEESIITVRQSLCFKCRFIYRPVQIIFGILLLLIAVLIFISLLLSNINKCIHFVNFKQIFAQGNQTLPNPIDIVLTWTGKVRRFNFICLIFKKLFLVLSNQLFCSIGFTYFYYLNISLWFTTNWYLVFLGSSKLIIKILFYLLFFFKDVSIFS
jgi:LMBR1 domain-containing protein 1